MTDISVGNLIFMDDVIHKLETADVAQAGRALKDFLCRVQDMSRVVFNERKT